MAIACAWSARRCLAAAICGWGLAIASSTILGIKEVPGLIAGGRNATTEDRGFLETHSSSRRSLECRRRTASELAKSERGELWAIAMLLRDESLGLEIAPDCPQPLRIAAGEGSRAIVAAILDEVSSKSSLAVLWAATFRLAEPERGWYVAQPIIPLPINATALTNPIRDHARAALRRALAAR